MRIPVVLIIKDSERDRYIDGWTQLVNVHGARVECKHEFQNGDEIHIQVPFKGKSEVGTIVWKDGGPNKNGNWEYGIKLRHSENLWGIKFPPTDWNVQKTSKEISGIPSNTAIAVSPGFEKAKAMLAKENKEIAFSTVPVLSNIDHAIVCQQVSIPAIDSPQMQNVDATVTEIEIPIEATTEPATTDGEQTDERNQTCGCVEQPPAELAITADTILQPSSLDKELGNSQRESEENIAEQNEASISTISGNQADFAPSAEIQSAMDQFEITAQQRIEELEARAIHRLEERVNGFYAAQSVIFDNKIADALQMQIQTLENNGHSLLEKMQEKLQASEQKIQLDSRLAIHNELAEQVARGKDDLQTEIANLAGTAKASIRMNVEKDLSTLESEFATRCQQQAEQEIGSQLDEMTQVLTSHMEHAENFLCQRTDRMMEEKSAGFLLDLESKSEKIHAESTAQAEQQIRMIGAEVSQVLLDNFGSELTRIQQECIQQIETQMQELTNQKLQWARSSMLHFIGTLGDCLTQLANMENNITGNEAENSMHTEAVNETYITRQL